MRNNWLEIWYSCSNLVVFATIETKSNKRKKNNAQSKMLKNNWRIFSFLFYQNDICILKNAWNMPIYISHYIILFSNL